MKILVTGAAGFIGYHLSKELLDKGWKVYGIDNINSYYDINLKYNRLKELGISGSEASLYNKECCSKDNSFKFMRADIEDIDILSKIFKINNFDVVCNLAAQAGVRYSIENPKAYIDSNIVGFSNILECCRQNSIKHLLYASSSSVYGQNEKIPFSIKDNVDYPISLYAATKKSNELMAHTYSHLFNLPTTGLRFFTVYGPWGRPDMAIFLFAEAISKGEQIKVFNNGNMSRDFTYIDDIINGIEILLKNPPNKDKITPYNIYNIGNGNPESLLDFINAIEKNFDKEAIKEFLPMQPGDVPRTWADIEEISKLGYKSRVSISDGVASFVKWYKSYYSINN